MPIRTLGIAAAITPTVIKTGIDHYTKRTPRKKKPTAHISYDQGIALIRSFLLYASHHTVEDIQAFTSQWVPHPAWIRTEQVSIPLDYISRAVDVLVAELGPSGIEAVGGTRWWQWRRHGPQNILKAEWVEIRSEYNRLKAAGQRSKKVMFYIHGGAYFFGSTDEHRYQLQRHARKLGARVFAPRYRLAPQFPFPCGLLDCLAAYLYLLSINKASEIVLAGDSAGGGMILSLLCILRDQGLDLPSGAVLISPWVDLTHSFPSLGRHDDLDYIPAYGFMQRPSMSWPPPNEDEIKEVMKAARDSPTSNNIPQTGTAKTPPKPALLSMPTGLIHEAARKIQPPLSLNLNGKDMIIKDQIQLYTTNQLITHPLVSPVLQPSLGGLCPLLIMVGDGELLRDEQIYVAHKAADPMGYKLSEHYRELYDPDDKIVEKWSKPTPVQLQVWEDLCHVAPTLSFTRPAKYMYRSVAQFSAWALARAQKAPIEINVVADDSSESSSITSSGSDDDPAKHKKPQNGRLGTTHDQRELGLRVTRAPTDLYTSVGKAGDPIPHFKDHMIRQQVDRHGSIYPLPAASQLPGTKMHKELVGMVKEGPVQKWLNARNTWDTKYAKDLRKLRKYRLANARKYLENEFVVAGERPPPSALAARHWYDPREPGFKKSFGLGLWASWGSKHDERILAEESAAEKADVREEQLEEKRARRQSDSSRRPRSMSKASQGSVSISKSRERPGQDRPRANSRRKTITVADQGQIEGEDGPVKLEMPPTIKIEDFDIKDTSQNDTGHLSPGPYLPQFKHATHLRDDNKDSSDTSTIHSNLVADDASNVAVFSAAGVLPEHGDTSDSRPRPAPVSKDHVGGYDTPHSRRSIERLQDYQGVPGGANGQGSVHSSLVDESKDGKAPMIRNASNQAVVQAEGISQQIGENKLSS